MPYQDTTIDLRHDRKMQPNTQSEISTHAARQGLIEFDASELSLTQGPRSVSPVVDNATHPVSLAVRIARCHPCSASAIPALDSNACIWRDRLQMCRYCCRCAAHQLPGFHSGGTPKPRVTHDPSSSASDLPEILSGNRSTYSFAR